MNKKSLSTFFLLLFCVLRLSAEEKRFYNPKDSLPLVIIRKVDISKYDYSYFITNEYENTVYTSKNGEPEEKITREKFFTSIEDYKEPCQIQITWDFKKDTEREKNKVLYDGEYKLHLVESDKKNKNNKHEYIYPIILDSKSPCVSNSDCFLSKTVVYKNKKDSISFGIKSKTTANNWKVYLDDKYIIYKSELSSGEENAFPPSIQIDYEHYSKLNLGKHKISVIAKDSAGNLAQAFAEFSVDRYPYDFTIFMNNEIVFKQNNDSKPFYYTGIGYISQFWKTSIYDEAGTEHFSDFYQLKEDSYCKKFKWDGISKVTQKRVPDGKYLVSVSCNDADGNEITRQENFTVSTESLLPSDLSILANSPVKQSEGGIEQKKAESFKPIFNNGIFTFSKLPNKENGQKVMLVVKNDDTVIYQNEFDDISKITWDGYDNNGNYHLSTGEKYDFSLEFENDSEEFFASAYSGLILDAQTGKISIPPVLFEANDNSLLEYNQYFGKNSKSLKCLADVIMKNLAVDELLIIEGNANYTTYPNEKLMQKERAELVKLSKDRAEIVKRVLVFYGLPEKQMVVKANGGEKYLTTPNDSDNWKNRRVEFFIKKMEEQ